MGLITGIVLRRKVEALSGDVPTFDSSSVMAGFAALREGLADRPVSVSEDRVVDELRREHSEFANVVTETLESVLSDLKEQAVETRQAVEDLTDTVAGTEAELVKVKRAVLGFGRDSSSRARKLVAKPARPPKTQVAPE